MKRINFVFISLIASLLFVACEKELTENNVKEIGKLSFSITKEHNALADISLKAGEAYNLDLVTEAIITIEKDGAVVDGFDTKTIAISNWGGGNYSTPDIALPIGSNYKLTKFELKNVDNLVIFATPVSGSELAELVTTPLPISFDIAVDATTPVAVDVLSTDKAPVDPTVGPVTGSFTDARDGKVYKTVTIGTQIWMAENLVYLPSVNVDWDSSETEVRYHVYEYDGTDVEAAKAETNYTTYGVLYNFEAAQTAAPEGWHLPTDEEWKILEMALGMSQTDADQEGARGEIADDMKSVDWVNGNGTDSSGFGILPGGGQFYASPYNEGTEAHFWTNTQTSIGYYFERSFGDANSIIRTGESVGNAISIRCVKD